MSFSPLLHGAYDIHVHSSPDVIPRRQNPIEIMNEAQKAGMAGILIKDHTTSTVGRVSIFGYYLEKMKRIGFSTDEIRQMVSDNPKVILDRI